jgi:integrase
MEWAYSGRRSREVIGDARITPLSVIRDIARRKLTAIKSGAVPCKREMDVEALCDTFMERHAKTKTTSWRQVERLLEKWVKPELGRYRIDRLTRGVVAGLHSKIGESAPTNANRVVDNLRAIYNMAAEWQLLPENFKNPCLGITRFHETKRGRYITADEMPRFVAALNALDDLYGRSVIWLLLLTACRESEILSLTWPQIDMQNKRILLVRTKQKREHAVPLTDAAVAVIKAIPIDKESPWVFTSTSSKSGHLEGVRASWNDVREKAKIPDVTIHDLRRTMGSWMASHGTSLAVIGGILGHSQPSTTAIYARLFDDARRKALESATELILTKDDPNSSFPRSPGSFGEPR